MLLRVYSSGFRSPDMQSCFLLLLHETSAAQQKHGVRRREVLLAQRALAASTISLLLQGSNDVLLSAVAWANERCLSVAGCLS